MTKSVWRTVLLCAAVVAAATLFLSFARNTSLLLFVSYWAWAILSAVSENAASNGSIAGYAVVATFNATLFGVVAVGLAYGGCQILSERTAAVVVMFWMILYLLMFFVTPTPTQFP